MTFIAIIPLSFQIFTYILENFEIRKKNAHQEFHRCDDMLCALWKTLIYDCEIAANIRSDA